MLSIKDESSFLLPKLLITGLCNSAKSFFEIISFLIPLPEVFYQKIFKPLKKELFNIDHILDVKSLIT